MKTLEQVEKVLQKGYCLLMLTDGNYAAMREYHDKVDYIALTLDDLIDKINASKIR